MLPELAYREKGETDSNHRIKSWSREIEHLRNRIDELERKIYNERAEEQKRCHR